MLWNLLNLDAIISRPVHHGNETAHPADVVAIKVINLLSASYSEFAMAEHRYALLAAKDRGLQGLYFRCCVAELLR